MNVSPEKAELNAAALADLCARAQAYHDQDKLLEEIREQVFNDYYEGYSKSELVEAIMEDGILAPPQNVEGILPWIRKAYGDTPDLHDALAEAFDEHEDSDTPYNPLWFIAPGLSDE
jgi:hypothetical protein